MTTINAPRSVYDFSCKTNTGETRSLKDYQGNVLLIVNTASRCGFTPQYKALEELYRRYERYGLKILAFPCNQFLSQEPGTNNEIAEFCESKYDVSFEIFDKIDVNGSHAHPLYSYLTDQVSGIFDTPSVKWNFTKFLVNHTGDEILRFGSITTPKEIEPVLIEWCQARVIERMRNKGKSRLERRTTERKS